MSTAAEKLNKIASNEPSKWVEKAEWRVANEKWLDKSAKIALTIIRTLRERGLYQNDLSVLFGTTPQHISKILKGQENLTLETITKFETILGITLAEVPTFQTTIKTTQIVHLFQPSYKKMTVPSKQFTYAELHELISCYSSNEGNNKRRVA